MARLAFHRAELLWELLDTDQPALSELPIYEGQSWAVKDVLAHIAAWDRWEHSAMESMVAGQRPDLSAVSDIDAFNLAVVAGWQDRPLRDVLVELQEARETWLNWLGQVPSGAFFESRWFEGWDWAFPNCVEVQWQHDAEHANDIASWRRRHDLGKTCGPKEVLSAALNAAREELLAAADVVLPEERASRQVCGAWTLKDVVGHLADWEWVGVQGLRDMAAGQPPQVEHIADIEAWNQAHAAARRDEPWRDTWASLQEARRSLTGILETMSDGALARSFRFPWGPRGTAYEWVRVYISHDREHAQGLRVAMGIEAGLKESAHPSEGG